MRSSISVWSGFLSRLSERFSSAVSPRRHISGQLLVVFAALFGLCSTAAAQPTLEWIRHFGTSGYDFGEDVSADGLGNVYIAGSTEGSLGGPNAGFLDAYVRKYDASGGLLWTRQFGTSQNERSSGVSADGLGNVYVVGSTDGSLDSPNAGGFDEFVRKYDPSGGLLWGRQFGTSAHEDYSDFTSVSVDGLGNVYVGGDTEGNLAGTNAGSVDAFVRKYDASGGLLWTHQFGTSGYDHAEDVSTDGLGNVYVVGSAQGSLDGPSAGSVDAFVRKYDASGGLLWARQFGASAQDFSHGVSADGLGNVYIAGETEGSLEGTFGGQSDGFVRKYDASGGLLWTRQLGESFVDYFNKVSADRLGNVYLAGGTTGPLGGAGAGHDDALLVKFSEAPEPTAAMLTLTGLVVIIIPRRR